MKPRAPARLSAVNRWLVNAIGIGVPRSRRERQKSVTVCWISAQASCAVQLPAQRATDASTGRAFRDEKSRQLRESFVVVVDGAGDVLLVRGELVRDLLVQPTDEGFGRHEARC